MCSMKGIFLEERTVMKWAKYRMVRTDFWKDLIVPEAMTTEDKYFYLYLLTNPNTTQIGVYQITKKPMGLIWAIPSILFIR
jgi:hypothetical protein